MNPVLQKRDENDIKDFLKTLGSYKWLIMFMTLLFFLLSVVYLYFTPSVYSTHAIIEVKNQGKKNNISNDLLQNAFYSTNKEIEKEIEILKTFEMNKKVIAEMDMKTQVFIQNNYKKMEVYGDKMPIQVHNLAILDRDVLGKKIRCVTKEEGFYLYVENKRFDKDKVIIPSDRLFPYNEVIETDYFKILIERRARLKDIEGSIFFVLHGDDRTIYENIIHKKLTIQQLNPNAPLIHISYEDNIPERATNYVNKLVNTFLEEGLNTKSIRNNKILTFITRQLKTTKEKLDTSEKILKNYKIKNRIINTSVQADKIINQLAELELKISDNGLKLKMVNSILNILRRHGDIDAIGPSLLALKDNATYRHLLTLQTLIVKENELSNEYTDEYPELLILHSQMRVLKKNILLNVENLYTSIVYTQENVQKVKLGYERDLLLLPEKEINLVNLKRKYEVNAKLYAYLLEKKAENDMIKVATISDYKIIEQAYKSLLPIKPRKSLIMLLALVLGFGFGIIVALIHNAMNSKIKTIIDIKKHTILPIFGVIQAMKQRKFKISVFNNPQSDYAEGYRQLRTDLQFLSNPETESKVILISSMIQKEGKSTVLANLSAIFQLSSVRVLVIDLNLRNPNLHNFFRTKAKNIGVSAYLDGKVNLADIIFPTEHLNLDIIPVGSIPLNPSELLLSTKLEGMLTSLRARYDYILIDSTALNSVTDTLLIMKYTDVNLIVLRRNYAKKVFIHQMRNLVKKYKIDNIGIVFNGSMMNRKDERNSYLEI